MLQPARQIGLAGFCFRHDRSARRRIDGIGERERFSINCSTSNTAVPPAGACRPGA
jgi:hypothetical protein